MRARAIQEIREAVSNRTWFSPLSSQNDPFDTHPRFLKSPSWQVKQFMDVVQKASGEKYFSFSGIDLKEEAISRGVPIKHLKRVIKKFPNFIGKEAACAAKNLRENQNISCFSTNPLDIIMWSYYSNSHSSFCYEFSRVESDESAASLRVGKIDYKEKRPTISTIDLLIASIVSNYSISSNTDIERIINYSKSKIEEAFIFTKSSHWSHEAEWRSIVPIDTKSGYHSILPYKLSKIIFGCRASESLINFVISNTNGEIPIKQIKMSSSEYRLL